MTSLSRFELYHPKTKQQEAFRFGYKTSHNTPANKCPETELRQTLSDSIGTLTTDTLRWCRMEKLPLSEVWLQRALKPDETSDGKEVILVMREGKALHSKRANHETYIRNNGLQDLHWCKIAIRDTVNNTILFRTIKNYTVEYLKTQGVEYPNPNSQVREIASQVPRWVIYGSQKTQIPSSLGADVTFWTNLYSILFLHLDY